MLIAIDTSTRAAGVAVYDGAQVMSEVVWKSKDHHTVELAPIIDQMLARAGIAMSDLKVVAVALGPGSFTGLRIGMALAKGMVYGGHLDLVAVPTLDILAASQPVRDIPLAAVLQAGRSRLAVDWYHAEKLDDHSPCAWKSDGKLQVMDVHALSRSIQSPTLVCGELGAEERHVLSRKWKNVHLATPAESLRRPSFLAELGWKRWENGQLEDPTTLSPLYLHIGEAIPG